MDFQATVKHAEMLLEQEARNGAVASISDLQQRYAIRDLIAEDVKQLKAYIAQLKERMEKLPTLPDLGQVRRAQAMLAFDNLAFLEIDTDGLGNDASLLRVLILDKGEHVLCDVFIKPEVLPSAQLLGITGINEQELVDAPILEQAWPSIKAALMGKYLLSYGLSFDQEQLETNAKRHGLEVPVLIADCLMERCTKYFREYHYLKLFDVCTRFGCPIPERPHQTALHRAKGQLHILQAMAQGKTDQVMPDPVDDDLDGDDAHPF